jgi:bacterial polymer biosynthesis proteins, WecB/TagA/CpsF family
LGVPRQEKWMRDNIDKLNVRLMVGLGGSIDGYAGIVKRAPKLFLKLNLEWFYRLIKEPKRIGRMMKLPKFIFGTINYKFKNKNR